MHQLILLGLKHIALLLLAFIRTADVAKGRLASKGIGLWSGMLGLLQRETRDGGRGRAGV